MNLKQFIKSKGFNDNDISKMSKQELSNFRFELNYLKRIGVK